jgi:predicted ATPase/DNA-binding winged helix-turn-helix (wHTH) protein
MTGGSPGAADTNTESGVEYRFDNFRLFPRRRLLLRGNIDVALPPRAMSVLIVLVERYDRIVSKAELYELVWAKLFVEDNNLMVQISALRKALGRDVIATIPGRGYQIRAAVQRIGSTGPSVPVIASPTNDDSGRRAATNLPLRLTPLMGRSAELAELRGRIRDHRLVTVAGPSGIGKTRLAVELGWHVAGLFPDGVWIVDLVPADDADAVASAVALPLQIKLTDSSTPAEAIAAAIASRRLLLIPDNCEHVAESVATLIGVLLQRVPGLTLLATSQDLLHVASEQVYRLGPLALPPPAAQAIDQFGAIELFVARAQAADRGFSLTAENADSIAEICRRLDGNPLALEMAAARLPHLGVKGLSAALRDSLALLGGRHSVAGGRHRTLRDMVAWSYDLLDDADKSIFQRLGVFRGSFSLEAAIAVAGTAGEDRWDTVDALGRLVDKSLVAAIGADEPRYRLLETTRFFAAEQLDAGSERDAVLERHARHFAELCDQAELARESMPPERWERLYRPEIDNVRSALDWSLADPSRAEIAIAIAGGSALLWDRVELIAEGRRYCDRALGLLTDDISLLRAATLLKGAGVIWREGDRGRSTALLERSAGLYRQIGDALGLGGVLAILGGNYDYLGRFDDAKAALDEAARLLSAGSRPKSLWTVLNESGSLALNRGNRDDARRCYNMALDLARRMADPVRENVVRVNLSDIEFRSGSTGAALAQAQAAVDGLRSANPHSYLARALVNLAANLILSRDAAAARPHIREALPLLKEKGGAWLSLCLLEAAMIAALEDELDAAAGIRRHAERHYQETREIRQPLFVALSALLNQHLPAGQVEDNSAEDGLSWSDDYAFAVVERYLVPDRSSGMPSDF